jgi:hypothetical protein
MKSFIEKTNVYKNLQLILKDFYYILRKTGWPKKFDEHGNILSSTQIGLNHRPGAPNQSIDNTGSLMSTNTDFTEYNDMLGENTKQFLENLRKVEGINFGRIRYMLLHERTGLEVHNDREIRYHCALQTNPNAFFGETVKNDECVAKCYNIPADGFFYRVDTTKPHFVFNSSNKPRVHLVVSTQ